MRSVQRLDRLPRPAALAAVLLLVATSVGTAGPAAGAPPGVVVQERDEGRPGVSVQGSILASLARLQDSLDTVAWSHLLSDRADGRSLARRALDHAEEIGLTDAQRDEIRDLQRGLRRDEIRRDASIEIGELELDELLEADAPDLDAVEAKLRELADLRVDDRMAGLRFDRTLRQILTAEQIDELEELSPVNVIFQRFDDLRDREWRWR